MMNIALLAATAVLVPIGSAPVAPEARPSRESSSSEPDLSDSDDAFVLSGPRRERRATMNRNQDLSTVM
jgi:hypothetical protein